MPWAERNNPPCTGFSHNTCVEQWPFLPFWYLRCCFMPHILKSPAELTCSNSLISTSKRRTFPFVVFWRIFPLVVFWRNRRLSGPACSSCKGVFANNWTLLQSVMLEGSVVKNGFNQDKTACNVPARVDWCCCCCLSCSHNEARPAD